MSIPDALMERDEGSPGRSDDLLWRHLKTVPAFRALLRAVEARFFSAIPLPDPVLDLGCGDGHFAGMILSGSEWVGVDPWWGPLKKAEGSGSYLHAIQSNGSSLPFPDDHFASIVSNSVLEHIEDVQDVLNEAGRVLKPDGSLVFTVPSHLFTEWLGAASLLDRLGLPGAASLYRRSFNRISRHAHTDAPALWASRLAEAGFGVERWQFYFSKKALHALELGHIQGLPSAVLHFLTGHWILAPWESNLRATERWVRPYYEESPGQRGAYLLFIARKKAEERIPEVLPEAQPYSYAELQHRREILTRPAGQSKFSADAQVVAAEPIPSTLSSNVALDGELSTGEDKRDDDGMANAKARLPYTSAGPILAALFFAAVGQLVLSRHPPEPGSGIRWYILSIGAFLLGLWRQHQDTIVGRLSWPVLKPASMKPRRWLYLPALLLGLFAQAVAGRGSPTGVLMGFIVWIISVLVSLLALDEPGQLKFPKVRRAWLMGASALFLLALFFRYINLAEHPFIINGIEASTGLEAVNAVSRWDTNPFATGFLTNPTLPLYFLGIPPKLLGSSPLSARLLSPIVGALTVLLTLLIGTRLYGKAVGVTAAIMIAGSHFHVHYSRLGMTNIWDPLVLLASLGAVASAWNRPVQDARRRWMLAGIAVGLCAYFFTSSRLLPLILAGLLLQALAFHRQAVFLRWRHILSMLLVALTVALPQIAYYLNNPIYFGERARMLGILRQQSGWLARQVATTGLDEITLLGRQLMRAMLAFNYELDVSTAYRPMVPLLGYGPAVLLVFGILLAILRFKQLRYGLLLTWLGVTIVFAGMLLIESPSSHRLVIATPPLFLLAGIALSEIGGSIKRVFSFQPAHIRLGSATPASMLLALALVSSVFATSDLLFYFGRYERQHSFGDRNTEIANRMADYLDTLDNSWTVYFHGAPSMYIDFPTIPFLATGFKPGQNLFDVIEPGTVLPPAPTEGEAHIFLPERADEIGAIQTTFPGGRLLQFPGYFSDPSFYVYEVER